MINLKQMRFTSTSQGDEIVAGHIERLIDELEAAGFKDYTLVVVGSFGRGEGVLIKDQAGRFVVINDYDFLVYTEAGLNWPMRRKLRRIARELKVQINVWHLDLIPISLPALLSQKKTMMLYDTRFGGQVVAGDSQLLEKINLHEDGVLPASETLNLLINRLVTLFEAHPETLTKMSLTYKARQLAKVWFALVDTLLAERGEYQTRYSEKLKSLESTEKNAKIERLLEDADFARAARMCKLDEDLLTTEHIQKMWRSLSDLLRAEIFRVTKVVAGVEIATMDELVERWRGGAKPSKFSMLARLALCRPSKYSVEQKMYLSLDESQTPGFAARSEKLVRSWYRAS